MILGTYIQTNSIIHKLDPRFKLVFAFLFFVAVFFAPGFIGLLLIAIFIALFICISKISFLRVIRSIIPLLYILIFAALINIFFTNEGKVYWHFGIITISDIGCYNGVFYACRLALLLLGMSLLTLTTTNIDITDASEALLSFLDRIHIPIHEICMMFGIALRFLPIFGDEFSKIKKAQESRGARFAQGGPIRRCKSVMPLIIPLFASAFRHADALALAMESRCYHGAKGRTKLNIMKAQRRDFIATLIMIIMLGSSVALRFIF